MLACTTAHADEPEEATRLFEEGRTLHKQGRVDEACDRFERSWQLERAIGTQLNLADCHERHNKLLESWEMFDDAARMATSRGQAERAQYARERADSIAKRLATIEIRVTGEPSQVSVLAGGKRLVSAPVITHHTLGGKIEVVATSLIGSRFAVTVAAVVGRTVTVNLPALDVPVASRRSSRVRLAQILGGTAVLSLIAGAVSWRVSAASGDVFDDDRCVRDFDGTVFCNSQEALADYRRSIDYDRAATGLVIGGAGLAAAAVIVYVTAPRDRAAIVPTVSSDGAALVLVGWY